MKFLVKFLFAFYVFQFGHWLYGEEAQTVLEQDQTPPPKKIDTTNGVQKKLAALAAEVLKATKSASDIATGQAVQSITNMKFMAEGLSLQNSIVSLSHTTPQSGGVPLCLVAEPPKREVAIHPKVETPKPKEASLIDKPFLILAVKFSPHVFQNLRSTITEKSFENLSTASSRVSYEKPFNMTRLENIKKAAENYAKLYAYGKEGKYSYYYSAFKLAPDEESRNKLCDAIAAGGLSYQEQTDFLQRLGSNFNGNGGSIYDHARLAKGASATDFVSSEQMWKAFKDGTAAGVCRDFALMSTKLAKCMTPKSEAFSCCYTNRGGDHCNSVFYDESEKDQFGKQIYHSVNYGRAQTMTSPSGIDLPRSGSSPNASGMLRCFDWQGNPLGTLPNHFEMAWNMATGGSATDLGWASSATQAETNLIQVKANFKYFQGNLFYSPLPSGHLTGIAINKDWKIEKGIKGTPFTILNHFKIGAGVGYYNIQKGLEDTEIKNKQEANSIHAGVLHIQATEKFGFNIRKDYEQNFLDFTGGVLFHVTGTGHIAQWDRTSDFYGTIPPEINGNGNIWHQPYLDFSAGNRTLQATGHMHVQTTPVVNNLSAMAGAGVNLLFVNEFVTALGLKVNLKDVNYALDFVRNLTPYADIIQIDLSQQQQLDSGQFSSGIGFRTTGAGSLAMTPGGVGPQLRGFLKYDTGIKPKGHQSPKKDMPFGLDSLSIGITGVIKQKEDFDFQIGLEVRK